MSPTSLASKTKYQALENFLVKLLRYRQSNASSKKVSFNCDCEAVHIPNYLLMML